MKVKTFVKLISVHDFDLIIVDHKNESIKFVDTLSSEQDIPEEYYDYKVHLYSDIESNTLYIRK